MGRKIKRFSVCRHCGKTIPTIYIKHHEGRACKKLKESLEDDPDKTTFTAKPGESIEDLLDRMTKRECVT